MKKNRWTIVLIGAIVMLFAGLIYSWSILSIPIAKSDISWSSARLSFVFTLCMSFFCIGGFMSSILLKKFSARYNLVLSGLMFFIGFYLASKADMSIKLYIGYGVFAGLASGITYNTIMSVVNAYFPEKSGLISGVVLMSFSLGSFIIGKVYQSVTSNGLSWNNAFLIFGIILAVVMIFASFFIAMPKRSLLNKKAVNEGFPDKNSSEKIFEGNVSKEDFSKNSHEDQGQVTTSQMIRKKSFWLFFVWAILLSASGLAIISQASNIVLDVTKNIKASTIATIVGLISIFNGVGRVLFGSMYDKVGKSYTMLINEILYLLVIGLMIVSVKASNLTLLTISFILLGLAYGGIPTTSSAYISDFFGMKNYSSNLSVLNMNLLISSFGSTVAGSLYDSSKSNLITMYCIIAVIIISIVLAKFIKKD